MQDKKLSFSGDFLYLTEDSEILKSQLAGKQIDYDSGQKLIDNISTDEITPGWVCFYYDETLGQYCLVGLRGGLIQKDSIKNLPADVIVSGLSKGCGSSRETAPYSEITAGIKLVIAKTIEKIYGQNCRNIGLLTSTDFGLIDRIQKGEDIPVEEFTAGLNEIEKGIVLAGGLFKYNNARLTGDIVPTLPTTQKRPMTLTEKIIAKNAIADAATNRLGIEAVKPGDALFCQTDVRFSHEYVTPMAESLFCQGFGQEAKLKDSASVFAFRDHLTFLEKVMPKEQVSSGLLKRANKLAVVQEEFTKKQSVRLFGEHPDGGSEAICHNGILEEIALPGQLVLGTDSHTCTAGALGCFAFGVGSTDMANAWYTKDVQVKVPSSIRYVLQGKPNPGICAKDVMLYIMAQDYIKSGKGIGKVMEFAGAGLQYFDIDERATLTNMAVEAGLTTGIIEPDDITAKYLEQERDLSQEEAKAMFMYSDADAEYDASFEINLADIVPLVATPGDPRNGVPISTLGKPVKVDIAYGGSCTGGKRADMDFYASVLKEGLSLGQKVHEDVQLYIQFGSQRIKAYAADKGYLEIFNKVGAKLIEPSCGACIKAGPGVSDSKDQVSVSAINRNFPGRSGPGQVYLASPLVVAASALAGHITTPETWFKKGSHDK